MKRITILMSFLLFVSISLLQAQGIQIKGKVTSADDGSSLPGATVMVKGTSTGTVTDVDGTYSITVPDGNATLLISYVGMKTQEVQINNQSTVNTQLQSDVTGLEEVVVTAIGIKRSEKSLGYSVSKVSASETTQKSEPDILKSLQGKVPGVDIRTSQGAPGSATRINIRGNTSFFGDNQPLFVVDGIPYSNEQVTTSDQASGNGGAYSTGLSSLDPNDIENINILKGSAAAALYGSRAANGVILVTTKSGKAGSGKKGFEVSYTSSLSVENVVNLPDYQNTYGNGANFIYSNANGSWGPRFDSMDSIPIWYPEYKEAYPELFPTDSVPYVAQPDNVKNLFNTGVVYENSISISGGNDKSSFNATATILSHEGYIPFSGFDRYNFSVGGSTKLTNGLTVTGNVSYANTEQVGGFFGENQFPGAASSFARALFLGRTWNMDLPYEDASGNPLSTNPSQYDNPLWSWKHNQIITNTDRSIANFKFDYNIFSWLNASYQIGVNKYILNRKEITDKGSRAASGLGQIIMDNYSNEEIESNFILSFARPITSDLNIKAIIGHNVNQRTTDDQAYKGYKLVAPGIYDMDNVQSITPFGGKLEQRRLWGIFADISLDYKNWLFLTVTGRNDWSSTLPTTSRSFFYPSVSSSFVFSDAFNLKNDIFTMGKLRASWAKVGKDTDPYLLYPSFENAIIFLDKPTLTTPDLAPNPDLKPEFTEEVEIGTILEFFNNRVGIDFTYYDRNSTNQIAQIKLAPSSGYTSKTVNIGGLTNKGVEIGLNLIPVQLETGFKWSIYSTFTKNKSEVTSLEDIDRIIIEDLGLEDMSPVLEVGQPYGILRGTIPLVDDETGQLVINPQTGFPFVDKEQGIIGDPNPDYKLGITNTFSYKGLSLSFLFDHTKGGDLYSVTLNSMYGRGVTTDTEDREHSWIIPGYYGNADGVLYTDASGNPISNRTLVSTNELYFSGGGTETTFAINGAGYYSVFDATVYRLREMTLSYDLPKAWAEKVRLGSISLSLSGRNLWYYAPNMPKASNFDPEVNGFGNSNIQGVDLSCAPNVRRYGVNLKVTF
jgi:TonB-linked SusC/RagA family outer membrane protein